MMLPARTLSLSLLPMQETSSERNRVLVPIASAMMVSTLGSAAFWPAAATIPVCTAILPVMCGCAGLPSSGTRKPLNTFSFAICGRSGSSSGPRSTSAPAVFGSHRPGLRPQPKNHVAKIGGSGAPSARAVPVVSRKQSRNGRPTVTAAPPSMPRRTLRRPSRAVTFIRALRRMRGARAARGRRGSRACSHDRTGRSWRRRAAAP